MSDGRALPAHRPPWWTGASEAHGCRIGVCRALPRGFVSGLDKARYASLVQSVDKVSPLTGSVR